MEVSSNVYRCVGVFIEVSRCLDVIKGVFPRCL